MTNVEIEIKHTGPKGSDYGYQKHKCRCEQCTQCHEIWLDQKRARTGAVKRVFPDYEHGTLGRYDSPRFKCRCEKCRGANAARKRSYTGAEARITFSEVVGFREPMKKKEPAEKTKTAPELKLRGGIAPSDRTFELTPVHDCGEELSTGGYCRRLFPCQIHPIGP